MCTMVRSFATGCNRLEIICCVLVQLDGQVIALLVQNLERMDETVKEDADGVHNTLGRYYQSFLYKLYFPYAMDVQ